MDSISKTLALLVHIPAAGIYSILGVVFYLKRRLHQTADYFLVVFLFGMFLETVVLIGAALGMFRVFVTPLAAHFDLYGLAILSGILFSLTLMIFRENGPGWGGLIFSCLGSLSLFLIDTGLINLPGRVQLPFVEEAALSTLTRAGSALLGGGFSLLTFFYLGREFRKANTVLRRNRIRYWAGAGLVFYLGSLAIFWGWDWPGSLLFLIAALAVTYMVRTYRLPDLQNLAFVIFSNLLAGITALLAFTLLFLLAERLLAAYSWYQPVISAVLLAMLLIAFYDPLLRKIQDLVQFMTGERIDFQSALREYSKSISNILDVTRLSQVALGQIQEFIGARGGMLYLVDEVETRPGRSGWRLRPTSGVGDPYPGLEILPDNSILSHVLAHEGRLLTQPEVDLSIEFKTIPRDLFQWLQKLDMEVLVPIHTRQEWIGLLAVKPRNTGASYSRSELEFLSTAADQTAVALQNARLVEKLNALNEKYQRSHQDMQAALQKMERIARGKTDFLRITAYELGNSLSVLDGYVRALREQSSLDPTRKEMSVHIERVRGILDSMRDIARVDIQSIQHQQQTVSVHELIEHALFPLTEHFTKLEISREVHIKSDLPEIAGDQQALETVFIHLLENALKFTPRGGRVVITAGYLPGGIKEMPEECLEVVIQDSGVGIEPRYREMIFAPFFYTGGELHKNLKSPMRFSRSLGIGLAVVRGIVEAHGGRVWLESSEREPGDMPGSEFHVVLPLACPLSAENCEDH